jgi:hypothetical protein
MIRLKTKSGLLLVVFFSVFNIWIDGKIIDMVLLTATVLSAGLFLFGLICKLERFMQWNKCDKWFKVKNGHS